MTDKNKQRMRLAILNAAEFIRGHVECGLSPEDVNEDDEKGLEEYHKACLRVEKILNTIHNKYVNKK